jgi:hypothetical protein
LSCFSYLVAFLLGFRVYGVRKGAALCSAGAGRAFAALLLNAFT